MEILNLVLLLFFAAALIWLIRILIRQKRNVDIPCRFWHASRVMILLAAALCLLPLLAMDFSWLTIVRSLMMAVVIGLFALINDGMGKTGFMYMGSRIPFEVISEYDVKETGKKTKVIMKVRETDRKGKTSLTQLTLDFRLKDKEEISRRLKEAIGKRYRRMKL